MQEFECEKMEKELIGTVEADSLYHGEDGTLLADDSDAKGVHIKTRLKHPGRKRHTLEDYFTLSPAEARRLAALLIEMADVIDPPKTFAMVEADRPQFVRLYTAKLATFLQIGPHLGWTREKARRALVAGNEASLKAWGEMDPERAATAAEIVRKSLGEALRILDGGDTEPFDVTTACRAAHALEA